MCRKVWCVERLNIKKMHVVCGKSVFCLSLLWFLDCMTSAYNNTCPHLSQRIFRTRGFCPLGNAGLKNYSCLFDTNTAEFFEYCSSSADFAAPGEKYVYSGRRRNVYCSPKRYQPFSLWSNESSECVFIKTFCNDEGQVIALNGSTINDRSCRCDYTRGYDFVSKPLKACYCIPSEEDCACYRRKCPNGYILNSDYNCSLHMPDVVQNCQQIVVLRQHKPDEARPRNRSHIVAEEGHVDNEILAMKAGISFIVVGLCLCSICIFLKDPMDDHTPIVKLVAAIDFGTAYTAYVSSTVKHPQNINVNPRWWSGRGSFYSMKAPTCVLLNKKGEVVSLGYQAFQEYEHFIANKQTEEYRYFERFKMTLYDSKNITNDFEIDDFHQRPMKAIVVFSSLIKELMNRIMKSYEDIQIDEIQWVLTVPAVWSQKSTDFIRKCAEKAGIKRKDRLLIAFESDAVSLYFQRNNLLKCSERKDMSFLVVDIGGGTVDITANRQTASGEVQELCKPTGLRCGGTQADYVVMDLLKDIFGKEVMNSLIGDEKYLNSHLGLIRDVEIFKCNILKSGTDEEKVIGGRNEENVFLNIPFFDLNELCKMLYKSNLTAVVRKSTYNKSISLVKEKLQFPKSFRESLFKEVIKEITKNIKSIVEKLDSKIDKILLSGGFVNSPFVVESLQKAFPHIPIVPPDKTDDANLAVVKGAVLLGLQNQHYFVTDRIIPYTYGMLAQPQFDDNIHALQKRIVVDVVYRCNNFFDILVKKNDLVNVDSVIKREYDTCPLQSTIVIYVYRTQKDNVRYIDDEGFEMFGEAKINIRNPTKKQRRFSIEFGFGRTEFSVYAKEITNGQKRNIPDAEATFTFL